MWYSNKKYTKGSNGMTNGYQPQGCPVEATIDVIGGKWKAVILFQLLEGPKRFSEIRRLLPAVTQRMLTLQLRELEKDNVVHREIYQQIPPKVEYSLTDFGKTLEPILLAMLMWGEQYRNQIIERKTAVKTQSR
jgi:DNA-binding HxlR family transcriptional regulator